MKTTALSLNLLVALILPVFVFAAPATPTAKSVPASETPFPAPAKPASTRSYWSTADVKKTKEGLLNIVDRIGKRDLFFSDWLKLEPNVGFTMSGEQAVSGQGALREPISANIVIGVDLKPATTSTVEYQTFIYLFGYCELRYRMSKNELSFNVWYGVPKTVASVTLPLTPDKWNRIQAQIDGNVVRLTVNGVVEETTISTDWSAAGSTVPMLLGANGGERPFTGSFNYLYFATKP
jgi:hypothetical protein